MGIFFNPQHTHLGKLDMKSPPREVAAGCSDAGVGAGSGVGKDILPTVRSITLDNNKYKRNILYKCTLLWNILPVYERNIQEYHVWRMW